MTCSENSFITIAYVYSQWEAACVATTLEGAGVDHLLCDQTLCRTAPHYIVALGGMRVQVRRKQAAAGLDLLHPLAARHREGRFRPLWALFLAASFLAFAVPGYFGAGLYLRKSPAQIAAQP